LYAFTSLQEGAYRFVVYDDANGNKRYDKGSLTPLVFPEFVKIIDDSVFIRRRWEVENFDIKP
jgi:hypothetical protein